MKTRRIHFLFCLCFNVLLLNQAVAYPADSLGYRALDQDWEGWNEAIDLHRLDLRPSINGGVWSVFAWPMERRPAWARWPDTAMWVLATTSAPTWKYAADAQLFPADVTFIKPPVNAVEWSWFWWVLLGLSGFGFLALGVRQSSPLSPVPAQFEALDKAIRNAEANGEALKSWRELLNEPHFMEEEIANLNWEDWGLSRTEEEVVAGLLMGWSAEETALKLVCTPSHIYNVRSQIRKKLNLSPNEDLERHIRRRFLRPKR